MFGGFASFVYRNRRRMLLVALLGIAVAGVFGLSVAKRLSPYGDTDPSTQSVQATSRYQAATGRQITNVICDHAIEPAHPVAATDRNPRARAEIVNTTGHNQGMEFGSNIAEINR